MAVFLPVSSLLNILPLRLGRYPGIPDGMEQSGPVYYTNCNRIVIEIDSEKQNIFQNLCKMSPTYPIYNIDYRKSKYTSDCIVLIRVLCVNRRPTIITKTNTISI